MIKLTPPMGWNSWNTFGNNISEQLIMDTAKAMVDTGLKDAGYEYVVIDDCWSLMERDENDRLVADPAKFPHGMKYLSDYIHSLGLKFGMYSCDGTMTCAGYPSSYDHEFIDAQTFAEWGVDYLKYDNCNKPETLPGRYLYNKMGMALETCGRDIMFSACNWGADGVEHWIKETGAHLWRSTGDINDSFASVRDLLKRQVYYQPYNGQGCWNDMDMLIVGMNGNGNVANGGCNMTEYTTHFAMWCFLASPLMIGCDLRNMSDDVLALLKHKELIAINQDPAARQAYCVRSYWPGNDLKNPDNIWDGMIWVKHLEGGDIAIAFCNLCGCDIRQYLAFDEIGLDKGTGKALDITEVISGEHIGVVRDNLIMNMKTHETKIFRCKVVER